jgi:hypothetical protein
MLRLKRPERPVLKTLPVSAKAVVVAARKQEVRPDQVIPLDDGEFRDF